MRVPSFERFRRISAAGAFFVCGMVTGAAVWSGLANGQYNRAIKENFELAEQIDNYKENIDRLQNDMHKESLIQSVIVFIEEPPGKPPIDVVTEKELKKRLKEDLSVFRGRRIYNIGKDAPFARGLLEKKIYAGIGQNDYLIRVNTMLIADGVLQIWVEARVYVAP
jgi:hypothetical protein